MSVESNVPAVLTINTAFIHGKSPISWLLEVCMKEKLAPPEFNTDAVTIEEQGVPPLFETTCRVRLDAKNITVSETAHSKKGSKTRCAARMLMEMGISGKDLFILTGIPNSQSEWRVRLQAQQMSVEEGKTVTDLNMNNDSDLEGVEAGGFDPKLESSTSIPSASAAPVNGSVLPLLSTISTAIPNNIDHKNNYSGEFIAFCTLKTLGTPIFEVVAQEGPPHAPIFTMSCKVGDIVIVQTLQGSKKRLKNCLSFCMLDRLRGSTQNAVTVTEEESGLEETDLKCAELFAHSHHLFKKMNCEKMEELKILEENGGITPENSADLVAQLCAYHLSQGVEMGSNYSHLPRASGGIYCFFKITFMGQICSGHACGTDETETKNMAAKEALLMLLELSCEMKIKDPPPAPY